MPEPGNSVMDEPKQDFAWALRMLTAQRRMTRRAWSMLGAVVSVEMVFGVAGRSRPFLLALDRQGLQQPGWLPSQADLFAEDWIEVR